MSLHEKIEVEYNDVPREDVFQPNGLYTNQGSRASFQKQAHMAMTGL